MNKTNFNGIMGTKTFFWCDDFYSQFPTEDLVKVAESGDYETAFLDWIADYEPDEQDKPTIEEMMERMRNGDIRYCENADGIFYINEWYGQYLTYRRERITERQSVFLFAYVTRIHYLCNAKGATDE